MIEFRYTDDLPPGAAATFERQEDGRLIVIIQRGLPAADRKDAVPAILRAAPRLEAEPR